MPEKVYTVKQVAEHLQTNTDYVYRLQKSGLIKFMKLGSLKVRESELQRFIEWSEGKDISDPKNPTELNVEV